MTTEAVRRDDSGFSLLEVIVAMGIFSALMVLVTAVFVSGIGTIADVTANATIQQEQQNAMESMTKLLRYTDNPTETSIPPAAIEVATAGAMTFYTYSGTGAIDRVPYKSALSTTSSGVQSQVWSPTIVNGTPTYPTEPFTRILVRSTPQHTSMMSFRYWSTSEGVDTELAPVTGQSLTAAQAKSVSKVEVTVSDSATNQSLSQTVLLVNPR